MSQHLNGLMKKGELVKTYLLTLVSGEQYTLIPCDAHGSVLEQPEGEDFWVGQLLDGGSISFPNSQFLMVEEDKYRVRVNNGQGVRGHNLSERQVEKAIERAPRNQETGEVQLGWNSIKDRKTGEEIDLR